VEIAPAAGASGGEVLGAGALGQVLAGSWLGTPVALKRTHLLDPGNLEMAAIVRDMSATERQGLMQTFWKECHVTAHLRHPNVVMFLGVVVDSLITRSPLFLMMEYVGGGTLHQLLYHLPSSLTGDERKTEILLDIARGLRYLHSQEPPILHLDIKPANILITTEGRAKLGDFGEAHVIQSSSTLRQRQTLSSAGTVSIFGVGTLLYTPPEMQIEEEVKTPKVDMFSFGVLAAKVAAEKQPAPGADRIRAGGRFHFVPEPERRAGTLLPCLLLVSVNLFLI
jgi:serine/threonine protein kinase